MVGVHIAREIAGLASVQHTAWMLVNLLARQVGVVSEVLIDCEGDAPLVGRVVPLAPGVRTFRDAVLVGAGAIEGVPTSVGASGHGVDLVVNVGPGGPVNGGFRACGAGWWGGISPGSMFGREESTLPFGPYVAACLAAGRVFFASRAIEVPPLVATGYSAWRLAADDGVAGDGGPMDLPALQPIDASLGGVGAVGTSWLHALWTIEEIEGDLQLADPDLEGVTDTNLNRCPLFGRAVVGQEKAAAAASICDAMAVRLEPRFARLQDLGSVKPFVISAVDTNMAREAIQALYPRRLLSGATLDARAEILRCDPTSQSACIRCFNKPEEEAPDAVARARYMALNQSDQAALAVKLNLTMEQANRWAVQGECGYAGDRIMRQLRETGGGPAAFAVGFVSVMAGTMLAAQTVRELAGTAEPFDGVRCRAAFTFLDPGSRVNQVSGYARDPGCYLCDPASPGGAVWLRRYLSASPAIG